MACLTYSRGLSRPIVRVLVCLVAASLVIQPAFAQPTTATSTTRPVEPKPIERRPVVVINLDLTASSLSVDLAQALNRVLETHAQLRPRDKNALYDVIVDPDASNLERARQKQREALVELDNGNFTAAARIAVDGQRQLTEVTPTEAVQLYADLAFLRGKALLGDNRRADAIAAFAQSQRLDPARTLDTAREPPDVVAAYNAAKNAVPQTGKIDVTVGEPGENYRGTVWIDGSDKGFAPNQYVIAAGLHVVWVTDPDRETTGIEVDVKAGPNAVSTAAVKAKSAPEAVKLQRVRQELARAPDDGARIVAIKRIAEISGVKDAVVIAPAGGKVFYQTWRSDDADFARGFSQKHELGPKVLPAAMIDDLLPPKVEIEDPGVKFPIPIDTTRWYQKPAYWAGIGFGASLVVVGVYYLVTSLTPKDFAGPKDVDNPTPELAR